MLIMHLRGSYACYHSSKRGFTLRSMMLLLKAAVFEFYLSSNSDAMHMKVMKNTYPSHNYFHVHANAIHTHKDIQVKLSRS